MELEQRIAEILDRMVDTQRVERFAEVFDEWKISNTHFHNLIDIEYQGLTVYGFNTSLGMQITFDGYIIEPQKGVECLPMLENVLGILAKKRNIPVIVSFNVIGQPNIEGQLKQKGYTYVEPAKTTTTHKTYAKTISP